MGYRGMLATESNDPVYDCYPPGTPRVDWDIEDFACMERNQNAIFDAFEEQIREFDSN